MDKHNSELELVALQLRNPLLFNESIGGTTPNDFRGTP